MTLKRTIPVLAAILLTSLMPARGLAGIDESADEPAAVATPDQATEPLTASDDAGTTNATGITVGPTSPDSSATDQAGDAALESLRKAKVSAGIESRRNRSASFEVRFGGQFILGNKYVMYQHPTYQYDGFPFVRDAANAGQIQIGVGGGWVFDFRASLTIPTLTVLTEFEFNLVKRGRWVPTVGLGVGWGMYAGVLLKVDVGMEFWILDWLAAYATVGIGLEIRQFYDDCESCDNDGIGGAVIVAPVSFGLEMRY